MHQHHPSNPHPSTDKRASKLTFAGAHPYIYTGTDRQTHAQTYRHTDTDTDKERERHTHTHTQQTNTHTINTHRHTINTHRHTINTHRHTIKTEDTGCEAAIHPMLSVFSEKGTEAVLLVDASNAFNSLNRKVALHNIPLLRPTVLINTYRADVPL